MKEKTINKKDYLKFIDEIAKGNLKAVYLQ